MTKWRISPVANSESSWFELFYSWIMANLAQCSIDDWHTRHRNLIKTVRKDAFFGSVFKNENLMRNISNVANHLRQGYGGQDVEVLPVPMLPITKKWEFNAEHSNCCQLGNGEQVSQPMRPYAVYVPLCVKAIISNLILYLKRKVAHSSQSSTKLPTATKP